VTGFTEKKIYRKKNRSLRNGHQKTQLLPGARKRKRAACTDKNGGGKKRHSATPQKKTEKRGEHEKKGVIIVHGNRGVRNLSKKRIGDRGKKVACRKKGAERQAENSLNAPRCQRHRGTESREDKKSSRMGTLRSHSGQVTGKAGQLEGGEKARKPIDLAGPTKTTYTIKQSQKAQTCTASKHLPVTGEGTRRVEPVRDACARGNAADRTRR